LRDELAFARALSGLQRRTVHLVAQKLGLEHKSIGEGEDRYVVVYKADSPTSNDAKVSFGCFVFPRSYPIFILLGNGEACFV